LDAVAIHHPYTPKSEYKKQYHRLNEDNFYIYHLRETIFIKECKKMLDYAFVESTLYREKNGWYLKKMLIKNLLTELKVGLRPKNIRHIDVAFPQLLLRSIMHYCIYRNIIEAKRKKVDYGHHYK